MQVRTSRNHRVDDIGLLDLEFDDERARRLACLLNRRRDLIASEFKPPLDEARALAPDIPTNFSSPEVGDFFRAMVSKMAGYKPPAAALEVPPEYEGFVLVTPESIAAAHQVGVEVHVWTVDEESEMRRLLALGVDGIITNFPERMLKLI